MMKTVKKTRHVQRKAPSRDQRREVMSQQKVDAKQRS